MSTADQAKPFRLPVQWVNRPEPRFPRLLRPDRQRHACKPGDAVRVLPSGKTSTVARIVTLDGDLRQGRGRPVGDALTLADEIDCSRGDVIAQRRRPAAGRRPVRGDHRLDGRRGHAARPALLAEARHADGHAPRIQAPKYQVNVNTLEHLAAKTLELNAIGVANLSTDKPHRLRTLCRQPRSRRLHPDRQADQRHRRRRHAAFLAAPLRRTSIGRRWMSRREAHAELKNQKPAVLWFTGLSGAGKSTIANLVEKKLRADEPPYLPARRRQCPPRAEQGSRLHRCRPRREYPPRRRGGAADDRCRADRASPPSSRPSAPSARWCAT